MTNQDPLDFIVFAAPKCATTSLYEALSNHPEVELPNNKELPFFCDNRIYAKGITSLDQHFSGHDSLRGTVSPQYGVGKDVSREETANRIANLLPNVKLIALLRHPVKRAYSHHKMLVSRSHETRTFEQALADCVAGKPNLASYQDPDMDYLMGSSYGSLLQIYRDRFSSSQIKVIFTEELLAKPARTINELTTWLGLKPMETEIDLTRTRVGGSKPKVSALTPGKVFSIPGVKRAWNSLPAKMTKPVEYRMNLWNTRPDSDSIESTNPAYSTAVDLLSHEVKLLSELIGRGNPWKDWD